MRPLLPLLTLLLQLTLFSQDFKPTEVPIPLGSAFYCREFNNNHLLIVSDYENKFHLGDIDSTGKYKNLSAFSKKEAHEEERKYAGITEDSDYLYLFLTYSDLFGTERSLLDVVVLNKSTYSVFRISSVDITDDAKESVLDRFELNNKFYVLVGNKKKKTFHFTEYVATPDSVQSRRVAFQGIEGDYSLLSDRYYSVTQNKTNSIHLAHFDNKAYDWGKDKILITAENNTSKELKENTYFFEFDFKEKILKRKDFVSSISSYQVPGFGLFAKNTSATNSFILDRNFYKTWVRNDSFFVHIYEMSAWQRKSELAFSYMDVADLKATDIYSPRKSVGLLPLADLFSRSKKNWPDDLVYVSREFKRGSLVINVNKTPSDTFALQLGTYVPEYSSSGGFRSYNGMPMGGSSYISGYHTTYFTVLLHEGALVKGVYEKSGYDALQEFIKSDEDAKVEENETNKFLKENDISVKKFINASKAYYYTNDNKQVVVFLRRKKILRFVL